MKMSLCNFETPQRVLLMKNVDPVKSGLHLYMGAKLVLKFVLSKL